MAANYSGSAFPPLSLNKKRSKDRQFLQEYLLKITEREKQTEQLSFTMLQSLENMEQKINMMSIYLEKMQILQGHLYNQPTNQPEPERDLYNLQFTSNRLPASAHYVQEIQFSNANQQTNEYNLSHRSPLNFMRSDFPRIRFDSEPYRGYNPTENKTETSLQTDPNLKKPFQYHHVGDKQVLQPNMKLTLQQPRYDRGNDLKDKAFSTANYVNRSVEIIPQKEWTAAVPSQRDLVYAAPRKNSRPGFDDAYTIKKQIDDLQPARLSLTAQQEDQRRSFHNIDDKNTFMNYAVVAGLKSSGDFPTDNSSPNYFPKQTFLVENSNQTTLNNGMEIVMTNTNGPAVLQPSQPVNNETSEVYRDDEEDFKQNGEVFEKCQDSVDDISLEQHQELGNGTNVFPQNWNESSISDNKRENVRANTEETKVNINLETQITNEIETEVANNAEIETGHKMETGKISEIEIKIAHSIEDEVIDPVEAEIIESGKAETIDKTKTETTDRAKTKAKKDAKTEAANEANTKAANEAKSKAVNEAKSKAADRAKTEIEDKAKTKSSDNKSKIEVIDKENSNASNKGKELTEVNRKSSIKAGSQVLKSSSQSISSKVESPIDSQKKTKIRRKSKSKRDSLLARKSSVLLSGESSGSGGSFFDMGLPLTSSAAYKSLIGAAPILPETRKKETTTESESEDDVERALAMAMNKTFSDDKEDNSPKKNKSPLPKQDTVFERKASTTQSRKTSLHPSTTQKMKLTKASRLALGLDSESDPASVQSSIKKEAKEESDEFDFFS